MASKLSRRVLPSHIHVASVYQLALCLRAGLIVLTGKVTSEQRIRIATLAPAPCTDKCQRLVKDARALDWPGRSAFLSVRPLQ